MIEEIYVALGVVGVIFYLIKKKFMGEELHPPLLEVMPLQPQETVWSDDSSSGPMSPTPMELDDPMSESSEDNYVIKEHFK